MLKYLRIGVSALALSAFVVAPIMTVATADYAYAKNGNGNGNGGGKGNGGGNGNGGDKGGNGKSADKGNSGKGHDKASKTRNASKGNKAKGNKGKNGKGFAKSVKNDFKSLKRNVQKHGIAGLFKQEQKRTTRAVSAKPTKNAPAASTRPAHRAAFKDKGALHPSNLGKLNGAINSSPRAKEAHIANGQYAKGTGPVSLAASLAVADYTYAKALDTYNADIAMAQETLELAASLEAANAIVDAGGPSPTEVEAAEAVLESTTATPEEKVAAQQVVDDAKAVEDAQTFIDENPAPAREEIDEAIETVESEPPSDEDVAAAEDALLAHYKGDLPVSEDTELRLSPKEQEVVDAVRDSNPTDEAIESALGLEETETPDDGEDGENMADEDDLDGETTDQVMVNDAEKAEQG